MNNLLLTWYRRRGWRGFGRLWRLLKPRDGLLTCRSRLGVRFLLSPFDYLDNHILTSGEYESEVARRACDTLPPSGVVWDVGANIGSFALSLEKLRPDAQIYAFEPNVAMISRLYRNAWLNQSRIQICGMALSAEAGSAAFYLMQGNAGMSSLVPWGGAERYSKTIVPVVTGDSLIAGELIPLPHLIKIDVEGCEESVLLGMTEILRQPALTRVLFEGGSDVLRGESAVGKLLEREGFSIQKLDRNEPTEHDLDNFVAARSPLYSSNEAVEQCGSRCSDI